MTDLTTLAPETRGEPWAIVDWSSDEGSRLVTGLPDEESADFALLLLENDALGDLDDLGSADVTALVLEAVQRVECVCGETAFAAELSVGGECAGCLS